MRQNPKINEFWNKKAKEHKTSAAASWADLLLYKEISAVRSHIMKNGKILDAGCANGFTDVRILRGTNEICGIDYAAEMIKEANALKQELPEGLKKRIRFAVADMLELEKEFKKEEFDQVLAKRAIINIDSVELQEKALKNIHAVLKKGGTLLLSEPSIQGLEGINRIRRKLGIEDIKPPWHNKYLDENKLKHIKGFELQKTIDFSSTYFIGSRVFYALLCKIFKKNPEYLSFWNKLFVKLPSMGNFGIQKLFILRKI